MEEKQIFSLALFSQTSSIDGLPSEFDFSFTQTHHTSTIAHHLSIRILYPDITSLRLMDHLDRMWEAYIMYMHTRTRKDV